MNIIDETSKNAPPSAHPSDFKFAHDVIEELGLLPTKEKVSFPLPNRSSAFAEPECRLTYNRDDRPQAEFYFAVPHHGLEMAHTAIVTTTVMDGSLKLHLQVRPNRKLRDAGHRSIIRVLNTPKDMAKAIAMNYLPGSPGRKVIPSPVKKKA
jgi:hypothetical protein